MLGGPEPQGGLRLEASWEALRVVQTTEWNVLIQLDREAPEREKRDGTRNPLGVESEMAHSRVHRPTEEARAERPSKQDGSGCHCIW